jgi:ribosome-associated toxin RatA of RatAB toxin-antitoxin module
MNRVKQSVLVPYSAREMFDVVEQVERYPEFLPWCGGGHFIEKHGDRTVARIDIAYHGLRYSFSTENENRPGAMITMTLRDGPFKHLDGCWRFTPLAERACKVEFDLTYAFSSSVLEKIAGPVFNPIANGMIDAFVRRAEKLYATQASE